MDIFTLLFIGFWIFAAYRSWGRISGWNWEWVNRQEFFCYVVKGVLCVSLGLFIVLVPLIKFSWNCAMVLFRNYF